MEFKLVLSKLLTAFEEQNIRYALMGGFAMGLWGGTRSTVDLDFLISRDDMPKAHKIMTSLGYELHHHSVNVSQYISPLDRFGGIDFIHAFREASIDMLQRAKDKMIFGGTLSVKTLMPEDIIGLKLQSIYNNSARKTTDMADIEMLVSLLKPTLDRQLLKRYFTLFEMEDIYRDMFEEKA